VVVLLLLLLRLANAALLLPLPNAALLLLPLRRAALLLPLPNAALLLLRRAALKSLVAPSRKGKKRSWFEGREEIHESTKALRVRIVWVV